MFSFSGDYKKKRPVRLGGKSRQDLTTKELEARLIERRKQYEQDQRWGRAARVVQLAWARARATAQWRQRMRDEWDSRVTARLGSDQGKRDHDGSHIEQQIAETVTEFAVFYDADPEDNQRYLRVLSLLEDSLADGALAPEDGAEWLACSISRVIAAGARAVRKQGWSEWARQALAGFEGLLLRVPPQTPSPLLRRAFETSHVLREYYSCLRAALIGCDGGGSGGAGTNLASLAISPFRFSTNEAASTYFARIILSIPQLVKRLGGAASIPRLMSRDIPWAMIMAHTVPAGDGDGSESEPRGCVYLLANMIALVQPQAVMRASMSLDDMLARNYIDAFWKVMSGMPKLNIVPSNSPASSKLPDKAGGPSAQLLADIEKSTLNWIHRAHEPRWLDILTRLYVRLVALEGDGISNLDSHRVRCAIRNILLSFIQEWPEPVSEAVLEHLTQAFQSNPATEVDSNIARLQYRTRFSLLWQAYRQCHPGFAEDLGKDSAVSVAQLSSSDNQEAVKDLQLLLEALTRILAALGDDEFLDEQKSPLSRDEWMSIARACCNIGFVLYTTTTTVGSTLSSAMERLERLRDKAAILSQNIFSRNSRRPFLPPNFWMIRSQGFDMTTFVNRIIQHQIMESESIFTSLGEDHEQSSSDEGEEEAVEPRLASPHTHDRRLASQRGRAPAAGPKDQLRNAPDVSVLRHMPFVIPFYHRMRIFRALVDRDRTRLANSGANQSLAIPFFEDLAPVAHVHIRRGHVLEDGFSKLFPILSNRPVANQQHQAFEDDFGIIGDEDEEDIHEMMLREIMGVVGDEGMGYGGVQESAGTRDRYYYRSTPSYPRHEAGPTTHPAQLSGDLFKRPIKITFIDQYGMPERGVDAGGLFKEFLTDLIKEAFDPAAGLFRSTEGSYQLYPAPPESNIGSMGASGGFLNAARAYDMYVFLGAVLGKALYEGILTGVPFAQFFLKSWIGLKPEFDDLQVLDEDLYRGLVKLKNFEVQPEQSSDDDEADVVAQVFGLDFTITDKRFGDVRTVPLVHVNEAAGEKVPRVTSRNRLTYLNLVANYRLRTEFQVPVQAFLRGLYAVIPDQWLKLLFASPRELQRLILGDEQNSLDVDDWRKHTVIQGVSGDGDSEETGDESASA
ncbi:ubiquitin-protein ligase (E3), partial [Spiromyces aspiralis]